MRSIRQSLPILLGAIALLAGLLSCSSTPTWELGAPDAMTAEHYSMALSAIDAKAKPEAQAALYLLRADVLRARTNAVEMQFGLSRMYLVTDAVGKEDWALARKNLEVLAASYSKRTSK